MKNSMITIVLAGLFTGSVLAEGAGGMGMGAGKSMEQMRATQEARFQNIDGDQDGFISRTEAENHPRLTTNWGKADANADDKLDATEFSAFEEVVPPGPAR